MIKKSIVLICLMPVLSFASWSVSAMHVQLSQKDRAEQITLKSTGPRTHYITVHLFKVTYNSKHVFYTPVKMSKLNPVRITPRRLILKGNSQRNVKMFFVGQFPKDKGQQYEVRFTESTLPSKPRRRAGTISAQVDVLSGYGVYLVVHPRIMKPKVSYRRTANALYFHNKGNVTLQAYVADNTCRLNRSNRCIALNNFISFPGRTDKLNIPRNHDIQIFYRLAGKATWVLK